MNRTLKNLVVGVAGTATLGGVLVAVAAPASAVGARYSGTPVGSLEVRPASGTNQSAIDYTTSAPCPAGSSFETRLFGRGLPDNGEVVTSRTDANFSTTAPISSSFSNTPQFFADKNATTLGGSYDVVLRCTDRFGDTSRGDFVRVITFSSPTAYTAQGQTASPAPSASAAPSASPSGSPAPSASATPAATPSAAAPSASASASPRPSTSATPTAATSAPASPTGAPSECATPAGVRLLQTTITATGRAGVELTGRPGSTVRLFSYSQPSTSYRLAREEVIGSGGSTRVEITPPTNTRLYAQQVGCDASDSVVLNVRTQISLDVVRNGVRSYTFSGRLLPARPGGLIASLYRVTDDGRQVLTAQTRASATTGRYTIVRQFTGAGRFGFVVRTGQDLQNAPGSSNVRSLLVF